MNDVTVTTSESAPSPTLLLVEDDVLIRMEIAERLRSARFNVVEAVDGEEAIELLRSVQVNLVLTDLHMPRMDGAALVEQIRAQFPQIPIFMASGQLPSKGVYQMLNGFFSKPLDIASFTSYLEATCAFR